MVCMTMVRSLPTPGSSSSEILADLMDTFDCLVSGGGGGGETEKRKSLTISETLSDVEALLNAHQCLLPSQDDLLQPPSTRPSSIVSTTSSSTSIGQNYLWNSAPLCHSSEAYLASVESLNDEEELDEDDPADASSSFNDSKGSREEPPTVLDAVLLEIIETERVFVRDLNDVIEATMSQSQKPLLWVLDCKRESRILLQLAALRGLHVIALQGLHAIALQGLHVIFGSRNNAALIGRVQGQQRILVPRFANKQLSFPCRKGYGVRPPMLGYLEIIRQDPKSPIQVSDRDTLFGNLSEIYAFNREFLTALEDGGLDPVHVSVFLRERQAALGHTLPLGSYLLKPVQRILKYHLLLQNIVKHIPESHAGYPILVNALSTMTGIAHHINEMKRKHEHAIRVQEIQSCLEGWMGDDLTTYGELVIESAFHLHGARGLRQVFLFERMLLLTKKKPGGKLVYKVHVLCSNLMLVESIPNEPLSFHVIPFDNPKVQYTLQARTTERKREWTTEIKRAILENYDAVIPTHARDLVMALGQERPEDDSSSYRSSNKRRPHTAPEYLDRLRPRKRKASSIQATLSAILSPYHRSQSVDSSSRRRPRSPEGWIGQRGVETPSPARRRKPTKASVPELVSPPAPVLPPSAETPPVERSPSPPNLSENRESLAQLVEELIMQNKEMAAMLKRRLRKVQASSSSRRHYPLPLSTSATSSTLASSTTTATSSSFESTSPQPSIASSRENLSELEDTTETESITSSGSKTQKFHRSVSLDSAKLIRAITKARKLSDRCAAKLVSLRSSSRDRNTIAEPSEDDEDDSAFQSMSGSIHLSMTESEPSPSSTLAFSPSPGEDHPDFKLYRSAKGRRSLRHVATSVRNKLTTLKTSVNARVDSVAVNVHSSLEDLLDDSNATSLVKQYTQAVKERISSIIGAAASEKDTYSFVMPQSPAPTALFLGSAKIGARLASIQDPVVANSYTDTRPRVLRHSYSDSFKEQLSPILARKKRSPVVEDSVYERELDQLENLMAGLTSITGDWGDSSVPSSPTKQTPSPPLARDSAVYSDEDRTPDSSLLGHILKNPLKKPPEPPVEPKPSSVMSRTESLFKAPQPSLAPVEPNPPSVRSLTESLSKPSQPSLAPMEPKPHFVRSLTEPLLRPPREEPGVKFQLSHHGSKAAPPIGREKVMSRLRSLEESANVPKRVVSPPQNMPPLRERREVFLGTAGSSPSSETLSGVSVLPKGWVQQIVGRLEGGTVTETVMEIGAPPGESES
ncbi:unnamed protein product [Cyprideis torosa]|uniref:Uncharacterized protein n=1 Tax=Cyprideis torosa TaxID=163714 RepID=A0A7R8W895_9CRUS|nr:unnamed protein product [Cyprideis torosa]CAG0882971.1 unnamed protein product [Cyprideis torosa]